MFFKKRFIIKDIDYLWKASDWIIQEIGCAFGREMKIILLIEKGLRLPGGLQGNLEYINFERTNPEKSYKKIIEMIEKLIEKREPILSNPIETQKKQIVKKEKEETFESSKTINKVIKDDWDKNDYYRGLIDAIYLEDKEMQKNLIESYATKFQAKNNSEYVVFKAESLYLNFLFNKENTLDDLLLISSENPEVAEVHNLIGKVYNKCEQLNLALKHFIIAKENTKETNLKMEYLSTIIITSARLNSRYIDYLYEMIEINLNNNFREIILDTVSKLSNIRKNNFIYVLALEALINNNPLNHDERFNLAYRYSEMEWENFSYIHYKFLTTNSSKNSVYWNNLGVAAAEIDLKSKSIYAYRKAEKLGETLAMSNLARKLNSVGFIDEAEELCNKALLVENYDRNVIDTIAHIKNLKEQDDKSEAKILDETKVKRNILINTAEKILNKRIQKLPQSYKHPDCILNVELKDDLVLMRGTYSKKVMSLSLLLNPQNQNA